VVLLGGPGEREIGADLAGAMETAPLNLIGETSVRQMMALLSRSSLMITNDSGPMHVAAAFDIPLVAIFGSTDHSTTSPLSSRCRVVRKDVECSPCLRRVCPKSHHRCMESVAVSDVLEAAWDLIG
jgi:heptosyltransferase-2